MALKLSFFYDVICPRSWIFYQVLQKKLPIWRKFRDFEIDYLPSSSVFLHERIYDIHPAGIISRKKKYMVQELEDICDFYGLEKTNFEITYDLENRRSRSCLLFLNYLRLNRPDIYQMFMERIMSDFWYKSASFNHTAQFFKLGLTLGVSFKEMDNIILHIEDRENYMDIRFRNQTLLFDERIVGLPWLRVDSVPGAEKLYAFTEILRLELMDELMAQTCFNPLNHNVGNPLFHPTENKISEETSENPFLNEEVKSMEREWKRKVKVR